MAVDYISRKVMDRYFDKFTRKLVRMNIRIMECEAAWNRLTLSHIDLQKQIRLITGIRNTAAAITAEEE